MTFNRGRATGAPEKNPNDFLMMDPEKRERERQGMWIAMLGAGAKLIRGRPKFKRRRRT